MPTDRLEYEVPKRRSRRPAMTGPAGGSAGRPGRRGRRGRCPSASRLSWRSRLWECLTPRVKGPDSAGARAAAGTAHHRRAAQVRPSGRVTASSIVAPWRRLPAGCRGCRRAGVHGQNTDSWCATSRSARSAQRLAFGGRVEQLRGGSRSLYLLRPRTVPPLRKVSGRNGPQQNDTASGKSPHIRATLARGTDTGGLAGPVHALRRLSRSAAPLFAVPRSPLRHARPSKRE
jgi:hypothetical protein